MQNQNNPFYVLYQMVQYAGFYQSCRWVFKSGWASISVVGIICPPPVVIGLPELPNSGWAKAHPAHPLAAALY